MPSGPAGSARRAAGAARPGTVSTAGDAGPGPLARGGEPGDRSSDAAGSGREGDGPSGRWSLDAHGPGPSLAACVRALTTYEEHGPARVQCVQPASGSAVLFFTWGDPLEVAEGSSSASYSAFVAGVRGRPVETAHAGRQCGIGVHLDAPAAVELVGMAGSTLADHCVDLDLELALGRWARQLVERLADRGARRHAGASCAERSRNGAPRVASPQRSSGSGPACAPTPPHASPTWRPRWAGAGRASPPGSPTRWDCRRSATHESSASSRLAVSSPSPRRLLADGSSSLAEVAADAGYVDQAHIHRDAVELAGCTPAELAARSSGGAPDP